MIGKLNHVAIATRDLDKACAVYRDILDAMISSPTAQPEHGVITVFIELPNSRIELLSPLGDNSPLDNFLARNPGGGVHHICFEVEDIIVARDRLLAQGVRLAGGAEPKMGAHGKPVLFLHPKDFVGTLIELEQI
jgi:methylmalonyl-CoA/ethylmalonyl-CoA epimerase